MKTKTDGPTRPLRLLPEGTVGRFPGHRIRFIVVERIPEDRSAGSTEIVFDGGARRTFSWQDPIPWALVLGKGKLISKIRMEKS